MRSSVVEELGVFPHFTFPLYFGVVLPASAQSRRASLFAKMLRIEPDAATPSETETWRVLNDSFEQNIGALPSDVWAADNLIVIPGLSQNESSDLSAACSQDRRMNGRASSVS